MTVCGCKRPAGSTIFLASTPPLAVLAPAQDFHDSTQLARTDSASVDRGGDAAVVHQLLDERDRLPGAARRSRWFEAGPPPHSLRDERARAGPRAGLQEVRYRGRRCAGQVSPAWRWISLRCASSHGAGVLPPLSAGGWPGKLRVGRWRPGGG